MTALNPAFESIIPDSMRKLPVDERGYCVPWFVAEIEPGKYDFRVIRPRGIDLALQNRTCWLCGQPFHRETGTFVIGPMCAVNRVTSEPPSHHECATFAVKACPFLSNPAMRRSPRDNPEGTMDPAGIHLDRNPGAMALWMPKKFWRIPADGGYLFQLGAPLLGVEWWSRGRPATRAEVQDSINSGLPFLQEIADKDGPEAVAQLSEMCQEAILWLPAA